MVLRDPESINRGHDYDNRPDIVTLKTAVRKYKKSLETNQRLRKIAAVHREHKQKIQQKINDNNSRLQQRDREGLAQWWIASLQVSEDPTSSEEFSPEEFTASSQHLNPGCQCYACN